MEDHYEETQKVLAVERNTYSEIAEKKPLSIVDWKSVSWTCFNCKEIFSEYTNFRDHQQSLHKISKSEVSHYQCNDCSEPLLGYSSFLNHMRSKHYDALKLCCDICLEILPDFQKLSIHRDKHGNLSNIYPIVYHCTQCETVHSKEEELKAHIQQVHNIFSSTKGNGYSSFNVKEEQEERLQSSDIFFCNSSIDPNQCKDEYNKMEKTFQCQKYVNSSEIDVDLKEDLKMPTEDSFEDLDLYESRSNTFSWNEMQHLELIMAVEANPALWDVSSIEYKAATQKSSFWQVVANAVSGMPSVDVCKKKWKSLRVQYARILKTKNTKKSGESNDENIRVTWRYFLDEMMLASRIPSPVSSTSVGTPKVTKQKRKGRTINDSHSEDVIKQQATGNFYKTVQVQQQSLNDEHQRFCDMLADELRQAYSQNPEGAQQLRRNLMMTVTEYWQNEQT